MRLNNFDKIIRFFLLGPSFFYHKRLIESSKRWSSDRINKFQLKKNEQNFDKILYKLNINSNLQKYLNRKPFVFIRKVRTGGTSGIPLTFYQDVFFTRQKERAYLFDVWRDVDYKPFDYRIVVRGNNPKGGIVFN